MFVNYHFSQLDKSLDESSALTGFEHNFLRAANSHGLKLFRTTGIFRGLAKQTQTVYRLESEKNHGFFECFFEHGRANVLMVAIEPAFQGSFWNFKDFLIKRVAATLFAVGITKIVGNAVCETKPVRQKRDWRILPSRNGHGTKLLCLYERLGFTVDPQTCNAVLNAPAVRFTWG